MTQTITPQQTVAALVRERVSRQAARVVGDGAWIEYAVANLAAYLAGATAVGLTARLGEEVLAAYEVMVARGSKDAEYRAQLSPEQQEEAAGNAGIVMHRTAQLEYDFRSEGRVFAREVAESINENLPGEATVFVFEEAFGTADRLHRLHWLIQLKPITSYYRLLELHVRNEQVRNLYFEEKVPAEKGGGTWARLFVPGSMVDVALTPQHWGMYAT